MKSYNVLYTLFGVLIICCYSLCMEPEDPRQQIIQLISIIKMQQTILGYTPATKELCDHYYFESAFEKIAAVDPKEERVKIYERLIKKEAIPCINTIIYQYPLFEDRVHLILERFHKNSLSLLRETIKHNEEVLKKRQLFDYYQSMTQQKPNPTPQQPITPPMPLRTLKHNKKPQEIIEQKNNEIQFTNATYQGLTYNYQAYLYWDKERLTCNINDPFITVDITAFDENGNVAFNKPNMPLPLPILLDENGDVKSEISLPLSPRPFTVNYKNTEPLQKQSPAMALNFYKNIDNNLNKNDIKYLLTNKVIQQEGNTFIHGQNSCKPLLENYFRQWNIPENEYIQIQEPYSAEVTKGRQEQPEEPKPGWFAKLQAGIAGMTTKITNFFRNIYRFFFR